MRRGLTITFIFGLLIGSMAALLIWYYQKSTSAEDGALALLDKLAMTDRQLRQKGAEAEKQAAPLRIRLDKLLTNELPSFLQRPSTAEPEDLTAVKGIGPTFAARLQEADIQTVAGVTAVGVEKLAQILQISEARAATILDEANKLQ